MNNMFGRHNSLRAVHAANFEAAVFAASLQLTNVAGTPLAPPLTDFNKPKAPSGPDLKPPSPGGLANSLGATPQLAKSAPEAAGKAASKAKSKVTVLLAQLLSCLVHDVVL